MRTIVKAAPALILALFTQCASALTPCPTSHFVPVYRFGMVLGDAERLLNANVGKDRYDGVLFDYLEFQTREPGYWSIYRVVMLEPENGPSYVAVVRQPLKPGEKEPVASLPPEIIYKDIDSQRKQAILDAAISIMGRTRYPAEGQEIMCLDGHVSQIYVRDIRAKALSSELVGEVYSPSSDTEADALEKVAHTLKAWILNQADEAALDASIKLAATFAASGKP